MKIQMKKCCLNEIKKNTIKILIIFIKTITKETKKMISN